MRPARSARGALALAALLLPALAAADVRLCVPAFDGPEGLGLRVATVLNLQVFQTLRKAPWPNPEHLTFPGATVVWSAEPLGEQSFEAAEKMARRNGCRLVLWGSARPYGDGIVVQSYLSVLDLDPAQEAVWVVTVPGAEGPQTITCGLPRRRWEFASIVLDPAIVSRFSQPDALEIREGRGSGKVLGTLGPSFEAARHEGDDVLLRRPVAGWVHLPRLSASRSEVADFTGGILRVLRGDWDGARELLERVTANPRAPTSLRVDAHLLTAAATERRSRSGARELARAAELNPYSPAVVRYQVMGDLAELARLAPAAPAHPGGGPAVVAPLPATAAARARELSSRVERTLTSSRRGVLPEQDAWSRKALDAAAGAKRRAEEP